MHLANQEEVVAISQYASYYYLGGKDTYEAIMAEPERNVKGYARIKRRSDDEYVRHNAAKFLPSQYADYYGHKVVERAFFSRLIPTSLELADPIYRKTINIHLRQLLPQRCDAVIEICCGSGFQLCDLYYDLGCPDIPFYGCELSRWSNMALTELTKMLGLRDFNPISMDIDNPDFSALENLKNPFFFGIGALVYAKPSPSKFFEKLLAAFTQFEYVLFEPISHELAADLNITPLFDRTRAEFYAFNLNLYYVIKENEKKGLIKIRKIIPDFIGPTYNSSYSLIHISRP